MRTILLVGVAALALAACGNKKPAADANAPQTGGPQVDTSGPATATTTDPAKPVVDGDATVKPPATATAGAIVSVPWTGPNNAKDYVDVVPRGNTATTGELGYFYTTQAQGGAGDLRLPTAAGDYDVRYIFDDGTARKIKATAPITVTAAAATLTAPAKAESAEPLSVAWTGPDGKGDYVDVVPAGFTETSGEITYAYTSAGTPAKFSAPGKAGAYQIRYVLEGPGGRKVLATAPLAVTLPVATLKSADSAAKGGKLKVEWTGPKRAGDYIDLVKKDYQPASDELSYFYTDRPSSSELTMPSEAGQYDVRYVLEAPGGRQILARRTISVR